MPLYIEMPKLADTMTEGTLVKWRKNVGDKVATGDVDAEVETDKATMEMESFEDGTLHELLVQVGEKVPIGARIAVLLGKGEAAPAPGTGHAVATPKAATAPAPQAAASTPQQAGAAPARSAAVSPGGRTKSSPLARKLAVEK